MAKRIFLILMCNTAFWALMGDARADSLKEAVAKAVITNPEILVRISQEQQAHQRLRQSTGEFLPSLDATASDGTEDSLNFSTGNQWANLRRSDMDISLTQNIFRGLKTYYAIKENHARMGAAQSSTNLTAQDLALFAAESYINVIRNQQLIEISKNNVQAHQRTFKLIDRRTKVGLSSRADTELASGRLSSAEADYVEQIKSQADTFATYERIIGDTPHNPHLHSRYVPYTTLGLPRIIKLALINNPAIKKALYDIHIASNVYKQDYSQFTPSIDLILRQYRGHNISGVEGPLYNTSGLVRLSWNLFRGGSDIAKTKEDAYKKVETQDEAARLRREIIEKTTLTYNQMKRDQKTLPLYGTHVKKLTFVMNAYRKQYIAGKSTLLDVLNSELELYNAKRRYITTEYDLLVTQYTLLNRMGVLLCAFEMRSPMQRCPAVLAQRTKNSQLKMS